MALSAQTATPAAVRPDSLSVHTLADPAPWAAALRRMPAHAADVYFSPDYYASWQGTLPGTAMCLHARIGGLEVLYPFFKAGIPGLPGRYDIASAYGYGGAITNRPYDEDEQRRFDALVADWCCEYGVVAEFVREYPGARFRASTAGRRTLVRHNLSVDLDRPLEAIWEALPGSTRRYVRKPRTLGLTVEIDEDLASLDDFQALYRETADRAGFSAFYRFDRVYFESVRDRLAGHAVILNVRDGDRLAASALCLHWGRTVHYHLGASSRTWARAHPSELVYWAMIEEGHRRGCRWLRLGGGMSTAPDDSLFRFKAKFASHRTPVHIATFVHDRATYDRLCADWARAHPELVASKGHYFLRYRETD